MTDRYAVLGWGSLLWDLDDLAPKVTGDWHMLAGPALPMEFAMEAQQLVAISLEGSVG